MACTFPFNQIRSGSDVLVGPDAFVYGSGTITLRGEDSAVTTADGLIHNYRSAITPEAQCDVRGDRRALDTGAPDSEGRVWPSLSGTLTFELVASRGASPTVIHEFPGIVSVEYDSRENRSSISIQGCEADY